MIKIKIFSFLEKDTDLAQKVNRIDQIEQWFFILGLKELSEKEAQFVIEPEEDTLEQVIIDVLMICNRRYKHSFFWSDFKKIGLNLSKEEKT